MIILNAGVPRSGTVLVNAILRELLRRRGVAARPINAHDAELPRLVQACGPSEPSVLLVHTHSWDRESAASLRGAGCIAFANHRDPRDVCVSLMRLHDHDFEAAAEMVLAAFAAFEALRRDLPVTELAYERLVADRRGHILRIAERLGYAPSPAEVGEVDRATSLARHRRVMAQVRAETLPVLVERRNRNRVLLEDPETLISDRHIQSGRPGRWRAELDPGQQAEAAALFADLLPRYGDRTPSTSSI